MEKDKMGRRLFQIALVAAIVILIMNDKDGWGWLIFVLLLSE
jgi:hypothetical protein